MELSLLETLTSGGPVAILAAMIFIMYRMDRRSSEKRLSNLLEKDQETREENTRATTELIVTLRRLNGRS